MNVLAACAREHRDSVPTNRHCEEAAGRRGNPCWGASRHVRMDRACGPWRPNGLAMTSVGVKFILSAAKDLVG